MLNPFPQLLFLGFFAPTLLRVAAAIAFLYGAYHVAHRRDELTRVHVPVIGRAPSWLLWLVVIVITVVALALLVGYGTQWAAIVGALASLKYALLPKRLSVFSPISRGAALLLLAICLSLLITGAGALAMDLPL